VKRFGITMRARHALEGYTFISLWIIGFFLFMAYPLGKSLFYSFQNLKIVTDGLEPTYIGITHYRNAFIQDVNFVPWLSSTVTSMIIQVPLILVFAMFSALLLNRKLFGLMFFRGIFFLPVIIAAGAVLKKLMNLGATQLPIFSRYDLTAILVEFVPSTILLPLLRMLDSLTLVMWDSGVQIIIFLAGLQSISPSLYEAAECDGATSWEKFWKITFPMLIPIFLVNTLYSIVNSFAKVDNHVMNYINTIAFGRNSFGYASALGWIYFIVIFIIIGIVFFLFRNGVANADERR
jgi:oligogalacturonide transport system permease protein